MPSSKNSEEQLLSRAQAGDAAALDELLRHNRQRLKQMVHVQLDARLQARVDPSDVVQEAMIEAAEAAAVLGISEAAVRMRQLRALQRFQKLIADVLTSEDRP